MSQRMYYSEQAKARAERDRLLIVVLCLALGAAVGTVLGLMFAPQSGHQTREELRDAIERAN